MNKITSVLIISLGLIGSANAEYLADRHSQMGLKCSVCHSDAPKPGDMVANEKCMVCHGPAEKLKAIYVDRKEYNPHDNHLGDIDCTICHKGHSQSKAYCGECHQDFEMPMK